VDVYGRERLVPDEYLAGSIRSPFTIACARSPRRCGRLGRADGGPLRRPV